MPSGGSGNHRNPGGLRARCSFGNIGNRHRTKSLRAGGTDRRDTGSSDRGPARQKARLRSARCHRLRRNFGSGGVGQDRVSARELRTQYGPRASAHGHARRNQGFGRGSCRTRLQGLRSMQTGKAGKRDASSKSAERRTARASALTGSPRGNRNGLRPGMDPGGRGVRACPDYRPSKPPITKGPLRRNRTRRDSGGRQQCRPPLSYRRMPIGALPSLVQGNEPMDLNTYRTCGCLLAAILIAILLFLISVRMGMVRPPG